MTLRPLPLALVLCAAFAFGCSSSNSSGPGPGDASAGDAASDDGGGSDAPPVDANCGHLFCDSFDIGKAFAMWSGGTVMGIRDGGSVGEIALDTMFVVSKPNSFRSTLAASGPNADFVAALHNEFALAAREIHFDVKVRVGTDPVMTSGDPTVTVVSLTFTNGTQNVDEVGLALGKPADVFFDLNGGQPKPLSKPLDRGMGFNDVHVDLVGDAQQMNFTVTITVDGATAYTGTLTESAFDGFKFVLGLQAPGPDSMGQVYFDDVWLDAR